MTVVVHLHVYSLVSKCTTTWFDGFHLGLQYYVCKSKLWTRFVMCLGAPAVSSYCCAVYPFNLKKQQLCNYSVSAVPPQWLCITDPDEEASLLLHSHTCVFFVFVLQSCWILLGYSHCRSGAAFPHFPCLPRIPPHTSVSFSTLTFRHASRWTYLH